MNAYDFLSKIEREIESLDRTEYQLRNTENSKWLIEEALPIAKLAISLKQPGLEVEVEAFRGNEEMDGLIKEFGFRSSEIPVQVTYCYSYQQSLRDEEVEVKGYSFGSGPITRNKVTKEIESVPVAVDARQYIVDIADQVMKRIEGKCNKRYATKMVLIVSFFNLKFLGVYDWMDLLKELNIDFKSFCESFTRLYLYNEASNEIFRII